MNLYISVKQLGKKQPLIKQQVFRTEKIDNQSTLLMLLNLLVEQEVAGYNYKSIENNFISFLSSQQISELAPAGKIGFGSIYNENKADLQNAKNAVKLAYEDGLFAVFINDEEVLELNVPLNLTENDTINLIRLTFLAGSYW